jgi:ankyrin repeat protein
MDRITYEELGVSEQKKVKYQRPIFARRPLFVQTGIPWDPKKQKDESNRQGFSVTTSTTATGTGHDLLQSPASKSGSLGLNTVLHVACWKGCRNIVERIFELISGSPAEDGGIASGPNSISKNSNLYPNGVRLFSFFLDSNINNLTLLQLATLGGHVDVMKLCLSKYKSWNINRYFNGRVRPSTESLLPQMSPLHIAASQGHYRITKFLLEEEGYSPDYRDMRGMTPLHYASMHGREDVAELLLAKKCDINALSTYKARTSLYFASQFGQKAMVELLFDRGADAGLFSNEVELQVRFLEKKRREKTGYSAFQMACKYGHKDVVDLFIAKKKVMDFEERDCYGSTVLHLASTHGHTEIVETLLENVKNSEFINCQNDKLETPLFLACRFCNGLGSGNNDVATLLLERGADPNLADITNSTPFLYAAENSLEDIADILASKGAILNVKTSKRNTGTKELISPLHLAARSGSKRIVSLILNEKGVDKPHEKADNGLSPLHVACMRGHYDIAELLLEHGADLNEKTTPELSSFVGGGTSELLPIHLAAKGCHQKIVELLLDRGSAVIDEDENGKTALHMAVEFVPLIRSGFPLGLSKEEVEIEFSRKKAEQVALVKTLLERGLEPQKLHNEKGILPRVDYQSVLQLAVKNEGSSVDVVRLVLEKEPSLLKGGHLLHSFLEASKPRFGRLGNGINLDVLGLLLDWSPDLIKGRGLERETLFHYAINDYKECKDLVELLLKRGADPKQRDEDNISPLEWALYYGYEDTANLLLNHGADPFGDESGDASPLHIACARGNKRLVERLMTYGCDPNCKDRKGRTSLHVAISNDVDLAILVSKIVNPFISDPLSGINPLHGSCSKGLKEIAEALLDHPSLNGDSKKDILKEKSNCDETSRLNETPLEIALKGSHKELVRMLLAKGADPNEKDTYGKKYVERLPSMHPDIAEVLLLHASVDINEKFESGYTPLQLCILGGHTDAIGVLLARGCDVNIRDLDGNNCLHLAMEHDREAVALMLVPVLSASFLNEREFEIKLGSSSSQDNKQLVLIGSKYPSLSRAKNDIKWLGRHPIHWAACKRSSNLTSLLLRHGAKADVTDENGDTPLHLALHKDNTSHLLYSDVNNPVVETISLLLSHNASYSDKNNAGVTPFIEACRCRNKEAILLFLSKGADPGDVFIDGNTALHFIFPNYNLRIEKDAKKDNRRFGGFDNFASHRLHILEILLSIGCDSNHINNANNLPVMLAFQNIFEGGGEEAFELLLALVDKSPFVVSFLSGAPLHWAIRRGRLDFVRRILDLGATTEDKDESGFTPLMVACLMALDSGTTVAKDILHLLLSMKVDVNAKNGDNKGQTALHLLANYKSRYPDLGDNRSSGEDENIGIDVLNLLLSRGGNIKEKDSQGDTPLHFAALRGKTRMVEVLLASEADCNAKNRFGITPLYLACCCNTQNIEVINLLVKYKADVTCKETSLGWTSLHAAISSRVSEESLKVLLEEASHMAYERDNFGQTPVHLACNTIFNQRLFLNDNKKRHNMTHNFPDNPRAFKLNCTLLELLFQNGASANVTTTMASAIEPINASDIALVDPAISEDRDSFYDSPGLGLGSPQEAGNNPLHFLLGAGAAQLSKNKYSFVYLRSPRAHSLYVDANLHIGRLGMVENDNGNGKSLQDITTLLIENGCHVDGMNTSGMTPFLLAIYGGNIDVIAALIAGGCDTNARYQNGDSALHFIGDNIYKWNGMGLHTFKMGTDKRSICNLSLEEKLDILKYLLVNGSLSPSVRNLMTGETVVQLNKSKQSILHVRSQNIDSFNKPYQSPSDKVSGILERWPLCMCVLAFEELCITQYDTESIADLFEFIGEQENYLQDNSINDPGN